MKTLPISVSWRIQRRKTQEYPLSPTDSTKGKISAKSKKMKNSFRKALDFGKKSGGGRIVSFLFAESYEIWMGSPAEAAFKMD